MLPATHAANREICSPIKQFVLICPIYSPAGQAEHKMQGKVGAYCWEGCPHVQDEISGHRDGQQVLQTTRSN